MRHPIRWLTRVVLRRRSSPTDDPASHTSEEATTPESSDVEHLIARAVRREVDSVVRELRAERDRHHEQLSEALGEIQALARSFDTRFQERLEHLEEGVSSLRETLDQRSRVSDERGERVEEALGRVVARTRNLEEGLRKVMDTFELQLSRTESGFNALRDTGERQLEELRTSHTAHLKALEGERHRTAVLARGSHERLGARVHELADALENESPPPLPEVDISPLRADETAPRGWRRPIHRVRNWLRQRRTARDVLFLLHERSEELEKFLRQREAQHVLWAQALRETFEEESQNITAIVEAAETSSEGERDVADLAQSLLTRRANMTAKRDAAGRLETTSKS